MTALYVRPDEWNLPLLLHVAGAMVMVGAVTVVLGCLVLSIRGEGSDRAALTRFGFRTALYAVLPSFIVMRIAGQWIASKENLEESNAAWIGIGYTVGDAGLLVLIVALVVSGIASRRLNRDPSSHTVLGRVGVGLFGLLLVAYVVATWAMTAKPD